MPPMRFSLACLILTFAFTSSIGAEPNREALPSKVFSQAVKTAQSGQDALRDQLERLEKLPRDGSGNKRLSASDLSVLETTLQTATAAQTMLRHAYKSLVAAANRKRSVSVKVLLWAAQYAALERGFYGCSRRTEALRRSLTLIPKP